MAMMPIVRQPGIVGPIAPYWPCFPNLLDQLKQYFTDPAGKLVRLLFRLSGKLDCPSHIVYQLLVSSKMKLFDAGNLETEGGSAGQF